MNHLADTFLSYRLGSKAIGPHLDECNLVFAKTLQTLKKVDHDFSRTFVISRLQATPLHLPSALEMNLPVTQYDEAVLRQSGIPVETFDADLCSLAEDMIDTMYEEEGIGLAAQQVGRVTRLFVMDIRPADPDSIGTICLLDGRTLPLDVIMPMALVNPMIEGHGKDITCEEGCLSLPKIRGEVTRPSRVRVSFQDLDGHPHLLECDGLLARCAQHELDHLDGILFIDPERMSASERKRLDPEIRALRAKTRKRLGQTGD